MLAESPQDRPSQRKFSDWFLDTCLFLACLAFVSIVVFAVIKETGRTNSYATLAASFLQGRLDVDYCFDVDCATSADGRQWVIFPPFPAVVTMPFVLLFGAEFSGFRIIGTVMGAVAAVLWQRIFRALGVSTYRGLWLTAAVLFASPAILTILRSNLVWFFAQTTAFLLMTAALHETLHKQRALLIGLLIGLAFLTRQMSIFYAALLLVMIMDHGKTVLRIDGEVVRKALLMGLPIAGAIGIYFVYNWLRFGDILETGYRFLIDPAGTLVPGNVIKMRLNTIGLFSTDYAFFNAIYLFFQGFHLEFGGENYLTPIAMDRFGTAMLAASPFLIIALLAPVRREVVVGWLVILVTAGIMLFYHSNGYAQINTQRYTLDWLPILFLFLAWAMTKGRFEVARLLILYALAMNLTALTMYAVLA